VKCTALRRRLARPAAMSSSASCGPKVRGWATPIRLRLARRGHRMPAAARPETSMVLSDGESWAAVIVSPSVARATARSISFYSSRTFPVQSARENRSTAEESKPRRLLWWRSEARSRNRAARKGTSSRRSRRGGSRIGRPARFPAESLFRILFAVGRVGPTRPAAPSRRRVIEEGPVA
jgi:hypothetical protein